MLKGTRTIIAAVAALGLGLGGAVWATSAASAAPAATPKCAPGNLAVWVNLETANSALGTTFYHLEFTNMSGHTCHLVGFPGVSATNAAVSQLGSAARRDSGVPATVVNIASGGTAHSVLGWVDAAVQPSCHQQTATFLRVFPPNDTGARLAFFAVPVCTTKNPVDLTIRRVQPGI
jgi:hypothetical protein